MKLQICINSILHFKHILFLDHIGCSSWCANRRPSWSQKVIWNFGERTRNSFQAQDHVFPKLWRSCQYYQDCVRRWWSFNCTEDYRSIYNLMKIILPYFKTSLYDELVYKFLQGMFWCLWWLNKILRLRRLLQNVLWHN